MSFTVEDRERLTKWLSGWTGMFDKGTCSAKNLADAIAIIECEPLAPDNLLIAAKDIADKIMDEKSLDPEIDDHLRTAAVRAFQMHAQLLRGNRADHYEACAVICDELAESAVNLKDKGNDFRDTMRVIDETNKRDAMKRCAQSIRMRK